MKSIPDNSNTDAITYQSPTEGMPNITLGRQCIYCRQQYFFTMPIEDFRKWAFDRVLIQKALPYFNVDQHEILKSEICPQCRKEQFLILND